MRIAMLSYRSKPHCGGQGVYIRHLSRELVRLGHEVEVFSGQPYPDLDEGVVLTKVPSLDLYREPDPFRVPKLREFRDRIDVEEFAHHVHGRVPRAEDLQPRVARLMEERAGDFDVAHDNQVLGTGIIELESLRPPAWSRRSTTRSRMDRRIDLQTAPTWRKRLTLRRWYGFLRMQAKVAKRYRMVLVPSESSQSRRGARVRGRPGPDADHPARRRRRLRPADQPPCARPDPGHGQRRRADEGHRDPARGLRQARRRARRAQLVLVTRPEPGGRTEQLIDQLGIADKVTFVNGVSDAELVEVMGSAEVACVPSLYEGFSLPTAELMACATPLVVSRAGAIPEVVGPDGVCADLVTPGDVGELEQARRGAARRPRASYGDGCGRTGPRRGAVQLACRGRGHRRRLRGDHRRLPQRAGRAAQEESRRADR